MSSIHALPDDVQQLMMYTRAAFYATEPSNAAVYAPVEACGAHEWSCNVHGWRAFAATQPPTNLEDTKTTPTKTIEAATAEQFTPPLLLSMRLRGGTAEGESGQESGEESGDEGSGDESVDEDASDVDSSGNVDGLINDAEEEEARDCISDPKSSQVSSSHGRVADTIGWSEESR